MATKIDGNALPILETATLGRVRVPFWSELHIDGTILFCKGTEKRLPEGLVAEVISKAGVGRVVVRVWYLNQLWYAWLTGKHDLVKKKPSQGSLF